MTLFGLHVLDVGLIVLYIVAMIWIGKRIGEKTKNMDEFFLAGRKLGRFYQFFLNFGCSTNADQAVAVSREIYRQGIGGMWIQYLVLFLTPFYWFTASFFRRVRLTTLGDYFTERFRSSFLGGSYAVFALLTSILGGGVGYMVAAKTFMALTPKPAQKYTVEERISVEDYTLYQEWKTRKPEQFDDQEKARFEVLENKNKRGELRAFVSYTKPIVFYLIYGLVVGIYTMLGGFRAAAVTDAIQGILIVVFSFLLIPAGLARIGGFSGLHAKVPDYMFDLFGSVSLGEYAWYTILAMILSNLVSIVAVATGMQTAGSATNENTARFGIIGGLFFKRFIMIFWALTGLLAIGLYSGVLHDPDLIWGYMTRDLLFPGAIGLMLVGILAANMSTLDASSVSYSALFIRNIYRPLKPGRSESHYMNVGKAAIAVTLAGGVLVALYLKNLLVLFQYIISIPAIFGAPIWLGFLWRRLTRTAVVVQVFVCLAVYALIPNLFPSLDVTRRHSPFLLETRPRTVTVQTRALAADVDGGKADRIGQKILKTQTVAPVGVYFESVGRTDPENPDSPKMGMGRFHAEIWILSLFGIDFSGCTKSQLVAVRFGFDAVFPFILLFLFSWITRPVPKEHLDRFFAKLHTPVQKTLEQDRQAVERACSHPEKFEGRKILRRSGWEIHKPGLGDILGFGLSWVMVGVILLLLWIMTTIR